MKKYFLMMCVAFAAHSHAQFSQQGSKLFGTGSLGSTPEQGSSVALSSDGNTAIVGGWDDNSAIGGAWVFARSGGAWSQQGTKLVGTGTAGSLGSYQGWSAALSADGNTAIIGGYMDNDRIGAAWIFTRSGGVWSQQGSKLVGTGVVNVTGHQSYQGYSVGLSADGNTAIVGGQYDNNTVGAAWIFTRSGGVWSQVGSKMVGIGYSGQSYQGCSVAMSGDGNTAVVAGVNDAPGYGAIWIYVRSGGSWVQQGNKIIGSGASGVPAFGNSVAISSNGNTVVVGGGNDDSGIGAAWVFVRSLTDSTWKQQKNKIVPSDHSIGSTSQIGTAISLSSDGNTAIVGGFLDSSNVGAAWIFNRSPVDSTWSQQGTKIIGTGASGTANQGYSVAMSGDGNTALVGGYADSTYAGATWVFATPSAPLPVELASFSVVVDGMDATLRWKTATEVNNYGFEIEKAIMNDDLRIKNWSKVGFVNGAGTSNAPKAYSFVDRNLNAGRYSYRLKQIDRDGKFQYLNSIETAVKNLPAQFSMGQNYPNPFNPSTTIQFSIASKSRVTIEVFNPLGEKVASLENGEKEAGEYSVQWNAAVASGIYFYRINAISITGDNEAFSRTRKMVVLK